MGFVFAPSPRRVTITQVAVIGPHLPAAIEKIGVFVDASLSEIVSTVEACSLTGVQLHFHPPPDLAAQLRHHFGPSLRILGVVHFQEGDQKPVSRAVEDANIDAILVDSRTATAPGGTGVAYDWSLAANALFQKGKVRKHLQSSPAASLQRTSPKPSLRSIPGA